jgi:hypothetical protein
MLAALHWLSLEIYPQPQAFSRIAHNPLLVKGRKAATTGELKKGCGNR